MEHLHFSVVPAGLAVPVLIGLDGTKLNLLVAAGQPIPPPVQARALLDTGSSVTAIAPWILQRLGLTAAGSGLSHTAAGVVTVNIFEISLNVTDLSKRDSAWLTKANLLVSELSASLDDADVLIGRDVLSECKLVLDGPARTFSLEF